MEQRPFIEKVRDRLGQPTAAEVQAAENANLLRAKAEAFASLRQAGKTAAALLVQAGKKPNRTFNHVTGQKEVKRLFASVQTVDETVRKSVWVCYSDIYSPDYGDSRSAAAVSSSWRAGFAIDEEGEIFDIHDDTIRSVTNFDEMTRWLTNNNRKITHVVGNANIMEDRLAEFVASSLK